MSTLLQDIRYSLRLLVKDRSFTITALLTLAVCIGANTAMFSIVRSVLLKPLPFPDSDRVVLLYNSYPGAGAPRVGAAVPDYFDRLTAVPAMDEQALFQRGGMTYGDESGAERVNLLTATPSFFKLVRINAEAGRLFTEDDGEVGKNQKVLLSYGFWQRKFAGDRAIVGKSIKLNGTQFEVVGVVPQSFTFLQSDIDVFTPIAFAPAAKGDDRRHSNNFQMIGHLRQGASIELVRQQVTALNAANDERFPQFKTLLRDAHFETITVFLQDDLVRDVKSSLYLLWGGVMFVLVIGCVNIANLVIVRSNARTREMATRHAIGGDLGRLARQLLTESMMLAFIGGALGLLLGWWTTKSVVALNLDQLPRGYEIHLDAVGIGLVLGLVAIVSFAIGIAPVVRLWRMNLNLELREESRGGTVGRRANLIRRALATVQVAIALVLLVGAGLLIASFQKVMSLDLGFDPTNVVTASVNLPGTSYKDNPALVAFEQRTLGAIRAIPGVEAAGTTSLVPFSGNISNNVIMAEGYTMKPGESLVAPTQAIVAPGYFEAMHVKVMGGRTFDARDTMESPKTVIIDERLAKKFWPGVDAVGRRLYTPNDPKDLLKITPDTQFWTVIGVVKETLILGPRPDVVPVGMFYFDWEQAPGRGPTFIVRTKTPSSTIQNEVRRAVAGIDPQLPLFRAQTMQEWIDKALVGRRLTMLIAMAFSVVALFLAAIGTYGVLAYGVSQRTREMGVRMALGGSAGSVFGLVLKEGLMIVGVGLAIGIGGAIGVGQLMKSELYDVAPLNPLVLVVVTLVLLVVALVASAVPAWRASRINPIVALSH